MALAGPVFVCHASDDRSLALAAVAALESAGFGCWIAPRDVPAGAVWIDAILAAIRASRCLLLVSSENAEASPHVLRELEYAVHIRLPVVAIRTGRGEPDPRHRYFIGPNQWTPRIEELPAAVEAAGAEATGIRSPNRPALLAPRQLRAAPSSLRGRAEQLSWLQYASRHSEGSAVLLITGPPGVGKTALAGYFAGLESDRFADGQLEVNLGGADPHPQAPIAVLDQFLRDFGVPPESLPDTLVGYANQFRSILADREVLIFLDNAADEEQVKWLLPPDPGCLAVITSRFEMALPHAFAMPLEVPDTSEAVQMLADIAGEQRIRAEPEASSSVARMCGDLPLAVSIAGAILRDRTAWAVEDLRDMLIDRQQRLSELRHGSLEVAASFELSWHLLSQLDRTMLCGLALVPGSEVQLDAAAAAVGASTEVAISALGRLARAHLVQEVRPRRYRMHDLLQLFGLSKYAELPPETQLAMKQGLLRGYRAESERLARVLDVLQHGVAVQGGDTFVARQRWALSWFESELNVMCNVARMAFDLGDADAVGGLTSALVPFLAIRSHVPQWLQAARLGLASATGGGGEVDRALASASLGQALRRDGDAGGALSHLEEAVEIFTMLGDSGHQALALVTVGHLHREDRRLVAAQGAYTRAEQLFDEQGLALGRAMALEGCAITLKERNRLRASVTTFRHALAVLGSMEHESLLVQRQVAWTMENLGAALKREGRLEDALGNHMNSLSTFNDIGDFYGAGYSLRNLGEVYHRLGRLEQAEQSYAESLRLFSEIGERLGQVQALMYSGRLLGTKQRWAEAVSNYEQALSLATQVNSAYLQACCLLLLASAYLRLGRLSLAAQAMHSASILVPARDLPMLRRKLML